MKIYFDVSIDSWEWNLQHTVRGMTAKWRPKLLDAIFFLRIVRVSHFLDFWSHLFSVSFRRYSSNLLPLVIYRRSGLNSAFRYPLYLFCLVSILYFSISIFVGKIFQKCTQQQISVYCMISHAMPLQKTYVPWINLRHIINIYVSYSFAV